MRYVNLGKSDLNVSELSFGCMSLGNDLKQIELILNRALDEGINYFDTADLYDHGENEKILGKIFKRKRDKVIIATKVGNQWNEDGKGWRWNPSKEYILKCIDESLARLQVDYIDVYQIHGGTIDDPIDDTIETFERLKEQGKIRWYGSSSIRPNVIREYVKRSNIVSNMIQYSLLDRRPEESCLKILHDNNIAVMVRGALAKGLLVNKPAASYLDHSKEEVSAILKQLKEMTGKDQTLAQLSLKYIIQNPAVSSAVVGIRTIEQLEHILETYRADDLDPQLLLQIKNEITAKTYSQHR